MWTWCSPTSTPRSLDGYQFALLLKSERPDLPVILTSGQFERSVAAVVAPFLAKPYRVESVLQMIQAQFQGKTAPEFRPRAKSDERNPAE